MIAWINQYVFGIAVPILLMGAGIFFGFRLGWFHLRHPLLVLRELTRRSEEQGPSPFRALMLALAGTLGVGNIVGVSAAIAMGGFGAIFWMWVSALCAMLLKYAEIVLAMRHRHYDGQGAPHGSAMHYIRACFRARGMGALGSALATVFALLCLVNAITMGSVIQVRAISDAMEGVFHLPPLVTGGVLALVTLLIIRRGTDSMLEVTGKLVPLMTLGYLVLSAAVLILRADRIDDAFVLILQDARSGNAALGGIGGFLTSRALRYGTMRGVISNEAGCGTAPTAHAVSSCRLPARQGLWGIFEVFADTILLCTVTALVIIVSWGDVVAREGEFMMMTVTAYSAVLGPMAAVFLCLAVLFFGFATILCWAHYGLESTRSLSQKPWARWLFIFGYVASVLLGTVVSSEGIWQAADFAIGAMTLINVTVLCLMQGEIKQETDLWLSSARRAKKRERKRTGG